MVVVEVILKVEAAVEVVENACWQCERSFETLLLLSRVKNYRPTPNLVKIIGYWKIKSTQFLL